jgi:hypothetical protein
MKTLNVSPLTVKKTIGIVSNGSLLAHEKSNTIPFLLHRKKRKALEEVPSNVMISSPQKIHLLYPSKNIKIKSPLLLDLSKTRALATKPPLVPKKSPRNTKFSKNRFVTFDYSRSSSTTSSSTRTMKTSTTKKPQQENKKVNQKEKDQNNNNKISICLSEDTRPSFSLRNELQHWKQAERFADLM